MLYVGVECEFSLASSLHLAFITDRTGWRWIDLIYPLTDLTVMGFCTINDECYCKLTKRSASSQTLVCENSSSTLTHVRTLPYKSLHQDVLCCWAHASKWSKGCRNALNASDLARSFFWHSYLTLPSAWTKRLLYIIVFNLTLVILLLVFYW